MMFRLLATLVLCTCAASAADLTLKVTDKGPPAEINESIRSLLQPKAVQLLEGDKPVIELWLAKELNLQSKPSSPATALDALKPATLLGVASFASPRRDYREDEIAKGTYTVRFAQQQQDGNHLGTAEFAYFAVLVPATEKMSERPAVWLSPLPSRPCCQTTNIVEPGLNSQRRTFVVRNDSTAKSAFPRSAHGS